MNAQPPSPEKIASWEEQALELLAVRTSEEKVLAHLQYVGCPVETARIVVARCRRPANARLRRATLATIAMGLGLIALAAAYVSLLWEPNDRPTRLIRPLAFFSVGLGMMMYGALTLIFDRIDARKKRGGYTHRRSQTRPRA